MEYRKINDEVLYSDGRFVELNSLDLSFLKAAALKNPRKRIRLCTHKDADAKVHEMFIIHTKDAYVRPHRHMSRVESLFNQLTKQVTSLFSRSCPSIISTC